ncbi:MAG: hypothetical protein V7784_07300 [Oceanospirillaceae bacterium]
MLTITRTSLASIIKKQMTQHFKLYIDMGDESSILLNRADVIMLAQQFGIKVVEGFAS